MDTLRGNFENGIDPLDDTLDSYDASEDATDHDDPPASIGSDERRMQVRAYNHWASLLEDRSFPSIEDLDPENLPDFGPYSVLLDFSSGIDDPGISYLGDKLAVACDAEGEDLTSLADVPARSLLSRITDHYMQILANQAPIGFEAEFVNQRGATILYRGILLPFSSDDDTIDFIYGVINWKEQADPRVADELLLELDQAIDARSDTDGDRGQNQDRDISDSAAESRATDTLADWADGPTGPDTHKGATGGEAMPDPVSGNATDELGLPRPTFGAPEPQLVSQPVVERRPLLSPLSAAQDLDEDWDEEYDAEDNEDRTEPSIGAGFGDEYHEAYAVDYGDTEEVDYESLEDDEELDEDEEDEEDTASILALSRMIGPSPGQAAATALAVGIPAEYEPQAAEEVNHAPAFEASPEIEAGAEPYIAHDDDTPIEIDLGPATMRNYDAAAVSSPVSAALPELEPLDEDEMELGDWLALARDTASVAITSEDRSRAALYDAVGRAYDFSLEAERAPDDFAEIVADAGLTVQDRAPLTPVVKLVFGADYDKTRLTEYAAVLSHAHRQKLERGTLSAFLRSAEGGLKGVVAEERRLKKLEAGKDVSDRREIKPGLARKLRKLEASSLADLPIEGEEFALVMVRRTSEGALEVLGEVPHERQLVEKAARTLLG